MSTADRTDLDAIDALIRVRWRLTALMLCLEAAGLDRAEREALLLVAGDARDELQGVIEWLDEARGVAA